MKRYKEDIEKITEIFTFGLIFMSIAAIKTPIFSYLLLLVWAVYGTYNLYSKFQYRNGKTDYILFPTQNDQYFKTTATILGLMAFTASIVAIVWTKSLNHYEIIGITFGLLMFLNGLFDLPKGKMKVEANELSVSGLKNKIDIRQLREISIYKERMLFTNIYDEVQRVDNLAIDAHAVQLIQRYITEKKNSLDLKTINNVC